MEPLAQGKKKLAGSFSYLAKTIKITIKMEDKLTFMIWLLNFVRPLSHELCYGSDGMFGNVWWLFW